MDTTRARFGDKTVKTGNTLGQVEEQALVYQRGMSAALAGLPHEKTDDPWYDAGWRQGVRIKGVRTRKSRK